jgi:polysaccharide export outer membrane protein
MNTIQQRLVKSAIMAYSLSLLVACSTVPTTGPSVKTVEDYQSKVNAIKVLDLNADIAASAHARRESDGFSESFGNDASSMGYVARPGDILEVSIWEAPPATLFSTGTETRPGISGARSQSLPEQIVASDGTINIPFAGQILAAGRTTKQIEGEILRRLSAKANQPQILVRILRNNTSTVTVVGEVRNATRMPLTPGKERLLDALAAGGGSSAPVNKTSIQLTRGDQVRSMSLDAVIRDPRQNIALQPGDIVTALTLSQSFTVLGAANRNEEINFEASGISLAQALGRVGGLQDNRSDARGVFIFRFENQEVLGNLAQSAYRTPDGKIPVIYRVDMKNPSTFFVAQRFPLQDKDVLYIANANGTELQKFLNLVLSGLYPIFNIYNLTQP